MAIDWTPIFTGMDQQHPNWRDEMPGPAKAAELAKVETWFGHPLPDDFKSFYLKHDGSGDVFMLEPFMSLADIEIAWRSWGTIANDPKENADISECNSSYPPDAVKAIYANNGWLPFFGDSQNFIALDFDPGPAGKIGQVISSGRDDDIRLLVADSFAGFIKFLGEQFTLGRAAEEGTRILINGKDRDFIQTLAYSLGVEKAI